MSITRAIADWLMTCPGLEVMEGIDTDWLKATAESYGLYKQPTNSVTQFLDGSEVRTEYYFFLAKQSVQQEIDRRENQDFLSDIEEWIKEQDFEGNYPEIDGIEGVEITNSFYMQETEEEEGTYQISIGVTYQKRR